MYAYLCVHVFVNDHCGICLCTYVASDSEVDKAKEIVSKLSFKFSPESFENPGSQDYVYAEALVTPFSPFLSTSTL